MKVLLKKGRNLTFFIYCSENQNRVQDFFQSLKQKRSIEYQKLVSLIDKSSENRILLIKNPEKFKKIEDNLYEIKSHQVRIWCYMDKDENIVLIDGYLKKSNKIPKNELKKAKSILKQSLMEEKNL